MNIYFNVEHGIWLWRDIKPRYVGEDMLIYSYMFAAESDVYEFLRRLREGVSNVFQGRWLLARTSGRPTRFMSSIHEFGIHQHYICNEARPCISKRHNLPKGLVFTRTSALPPTPDPVLIASVLGLESSILFYHPESVDDLSVIHKTIFENPEQIDIRRLFQNGLTELAVRTDLDSERFSICYCLVLNSDIELLHPLIAPEQEFIRVERSEFVALYFSQAVQRIWN